MEAWDGGEDAKFVFQCKLFTETLVDSGDPAIIRLLFIQGVYNIITGTYPCNYSDAVQLAALQLQSKFGEHKPAVHKMGYLTNTLHEYVPAPWTDADSFDKADFEAQVYQKHAISMTANPMEAYLNVVSRRDYYGCVLFGVKQRYDRALPKKLFLGIARQGILLLRIPKSFTDSDSMETLAQYPLADIFRWAYKPGVNFYFELKVDDAPENPVFTFETREGQHMSDLLTDYALALLREMGLNADGTQRAKKVAASKPKHAETLGSIVTSEAAYADVEGDAGHLAKSAARAAAWDGDSDSEDESAPASAAAAAPSETAAEPAAAGGGGGGGEDLPPNWTKEWDDNHGMHYYVNTVTGESLWEPPTE